MGGACHVWSCQGADLACCILHRTQGPVAAVQRLSAAYEGLAPAAEAAMSCNPLLRQRVWTWEP